MTARLARGTGWASSTWRIARASFDRFYADRCLEAAAALTYTSLLSLVPLFALMFAVLKGLGAQHRLEPVLLSRLALDPEVTERIMTFIDNTNVRTIGAIGAAFLVVTVISVLGSIESSFNIIWRVVRGRSWWRKITDYVAVVLLIPFLLLLAVGITSAVREQTFLQQLLQVEVLHGAVLLALRLAPIAMNVVAIAILYAVMPNRRPHVKSILIAALLAGIAWQVVQVAYVSLQIGVARASAVYGALAQLPVTLVWIYVSWTVVLAGAELAAVIEYGPEPEPEAARDVSRWAVALHVLVRAAERFRGSGGAIELGEVGKELDVSSETVAEVVAKLCKAHALAVVDDDGKESFVLARDPAMLDLSLLADEFGEARPPEGADARVCALLHGLEEQRRRELASRTLVELVEAPTADGATCAETPARPELVRSAR
ncbi:MAG: YihY/virulence factor BrkB family protein [Thermodesulfobacteriota bacterium]